MRAGKRLDCFRASYTNDPLVNYRLNIAKAGYPSWMMLSMDELGRVPNPTPELLEAGEKLDEEKAKQAKEAEEKANPVEVHDEVIPEPHVVAATEHDETRHGAKNKHK